MHLLKPRSSTLLPEGEVLLRRVRLRLCEQGYRAFELAPRVRYHPEDLMLVLHRRDPRGPVHDTAKAVLLRLTRTGRVSLRTFGAEADSEELKRLLEGVEGTESLLLHAPFPPTPGRSGWWEMLSPKCQREWSLLFGTHYGRAR